MEATVVSVGKSVLVGALGYARSKAAEEVALQLGVEGDVAFIADELEMMQSFLMTADEERGQHKVLVTWVKHVRDLAYNVEDNLMDFSLLSEKKESWWRCPRTAVERRRIAMEMKKLRTMVEDVSNRNLRYRLTTETAGSKPTAVEEQANIASAAMFGISDANLANMGKEESEADLRQLITSEGEELRVIAVWGTSGDLGKASAIQEVYDDPKVLEKFGFCAWIRLMRPFNPQEFLRGLVRQFYENSSNEVGNWEKETSIGSNVLMKMEKMEQNELVHVFNTQVSRNSYLVVIDDLSTIVEWHCIKKYFPDNKKQSRIIVSSQQVEIASLCSEKPYQVSVLKQLSCDQTIYVFHKKNSEELASMASACAAMLNTNKQKQAASDKEKSKNSEERASMASASAEMLDINKQKQATIEKEKLKAVHASCSAEPIPDSNEVSSTEKNTAMPASEILEEDQEPKNENEDKFSNSTARKKFGRSRTLALVDEVICGRETEKSLVIRLIGQPDNNQGRKVISVWGMGGLGKTTLVRSVYRSQQLGGWKRAWATALRPFNAVALLRDLTLQLQKSIQEDPAEAANKAQNKIIQVMTFQELKDELARLLKIQKCLVVLDDISSSSEWELIKGCLDNAGRIIVTTREKNIAKHCSREYKNMCSLEALEDEAALDLFIKKVFKDNSEIDLLPAMLEQARLILKKCDGLPLAISTIGGFLSTKPKTVIEWRKLYDCIGSELEINPELRTIKSVLMRSYDGLPYHLKSAFLYLSIFLEDHRIRWDRLVRRWIAEGYSRDMNGRTAEEIGLRYFDELFDRCMILPGEEVNHHNGKINSCQLHDMIREICILKAREENLVFTLEEGCCLSSTQGAIRHLVIGSNWKRDKDVLENMLDLSHVRSLTVFGDWRPFFISDKMRFLRVLDLEDTRGLRDHHLDQIRQLCHLVYLSLRECMNIFCLPNSLGNLKHLQTLDVRGTRIFELPATITKLRKLQHLRTTDCLHIAGNVKGEDNIFDKYIYRDGVSLLDNLWGKSCLLLLYTAMLRPRVLDADLNMHDILNMYRFAMLYLAETGNIWDDRVYGLKVPSGIGKLKALDTLGVVNIARSKGKATLKELGELSQLRKLAVTGVSDKNSKELWSAIAGHNQLRSLSVQCDYYAELDGSLGEALWPPSCLVSLKLLGKLVRLSE